LFKLYKLTLDEYNNNLSDTERITVINLMSLCLEKDYGERYVRELLDVNKIGIAYRIKHRISNSKILDEIKKSEFKETVENYFDPHINRELLNHPKIPDIDKHMIFREWIVKGSISNIENVRQKVNELLQTPSDLNRLIAYFLYVQSDDVFTDDLRVLQYYAKLVEVIDWEKLNELMHRENNINHRSIQFAKRLENTAYTIITRSLKDVHDNLGRKAVETDIDSRYYPEYIMISKRGNPEINKEIHKYLEY